MTAEGKAGREDCKAGGYAKEPLAGACTKGELQQTHYTAAGPLSLASTEEPWKSKDDIFEKNMSWDGGGDGTNLSYMLTEARCQLGIAWPLVGMNILNFLLNFASVVFVGHLGELELASASLAFSLGGVLGYSVMMGLAGAVETLCGQAYGARQYDMLGIYLQRAILLLTLTCIPISLIWFRMSSILLFIGQNPHIAKMAGQYMVCLVPSLFAYAVIQPLVRYMQVGYTAGSSTHLFWDSWLVTYFTCSFMGLSGLQAQSVTLPMAYCSLVVLVLHLPLNYLLIFPVGLGFKGAAIATSFSNCLNLLFLLLYVFGPLQVYMAWLVLEGIPRLGRVSALAICLNTAGLCYMLPVSISAAASTRVANEIGAGRHRGARRAAHVAIFLVSTQSFVQSGVIFMVHKLWGWIFTSDQEVLDLVSQLLIVQAFLVIPDGISAGMGGVIRGSGRQFVATFINMGAYYLVGFPLAYLLGFVFRMQAVGLWVAVTVALYIQCGLVSTLVLLTNWEHIVEEAHCFPIPELPTSSVEQYRVVGVDEDE
eukprot:SM000157S02096  [mRNA]  locus=s157:323665:326731:- [translate_table: standard]